jgi:hypothetical protein
VLKLEYLFYFFQDFLEKIYNGTTKSELHDKFLTGTIRERAKMKHRGFGPIDDDEQVNINRQQMMQKDMGSCSCIILVIIVAGYSELH